MHAFMALFLISIDNIKGLIDNFHEMELSRE